MNETTNHTSFDGFKWFFLIFKANYVAERYLQYDVAPFPQLISIHAQMVKYIKVNERIFGRKAGACYQRVYVEQR